MKNYIIITGGAGFVGSNLIEKLLKNTKKKIINFSRFQFPIMGDHMKKEKKLV